MTAARAGVLAMSIVACTHPRPPVNRAAELARVERWWIVIGSSPVLESLDWRHYARDTQMVVLSGDPRIPIGDFPAATIRLAYLSVGEAERAEPLLAGGARSAVPRRAESRLAGQHAGRHPRRALAGDAACATRCRG